MHTYCNGEGGWQAGYQHSNGGAFRPLGPTFDFEWEAAAYASFLNGGRFSPGEIELLFGVDRSPDEDDALKKAIVEGVSLQRLVVRFAGEERHVHAGRVRHLLQLREVGVRSAE